MERVCFIFTTKDVAFKNLMPTKKLQNTIVILEERSEWIKEEKNVENIFTTSQNVTGTWRGDFTDPISGIAFTRDGFFNMSTNFGESYTIMLNKSISDMALALHDPEFFMTSTNPATVPRYIILPCSKDKPKLKIC